MLKKEDKLLNLKDELRQKLPESQIHVSLKDGTAGYYDYYGVTFRETPEEWQTVENYIIGAIEANVGFKIRITEWGISNNGHFVHYFQRI